MHFVIINASPHTKESSNTALITDAFQKGLTKAGCTSDIYHLSQKSQWENAKNAFYNSENIVFALPVFAAIIPGMLMRFLEELSSECKGKTNRKVSFIIQSGFPEANQRHCCENYLKTLPDLLLSEFSGILSYGINSRFIDNKELKQMLSEFEDMGVSFAHNGGNFFFSEAENFTGKEYITQAEAKKFNRMFNFFCKHIAESKGCLDTDMQPLIQEK